MKKAHHKVIFAVRFYFYFYAQRRKRDFISAKLHQRHNSRNQNVRLVRESVFHDCALLCVTERKTYELRLHRVLDVTLKLLQFGKGFVQLLRITLLLRCFFFSLLLSRLNLLRNFGRDGYFSVELFLRNNPVISWVTI